ncbi:TetR/AcrR family transcriptional regulator [Sphaerisporangium fuscum]|uniref:TetR/AcrR family transcriptional regulator n=1 Tax=Sphaerisporangium fuscum TaxID=2835868 RepID=UPI001BDDA1F3|nr:TetR/AcrR family transcriptional regulator [Sphaerisporangium fuscum]
MTTSDIPVPGGSPGAVRPRRADARRNYELLLAAAKDLFGEQGPDAPLDEVARRAGVGNATMYRHFPTRRELIIAVYADEVTELCAHGRALLDAPSPGDALFAWLAAFISHVATKRELALSLNDDRSGRRSELFDGWHRAMRSTAEALLGRARHAGAVRPDLEVTDLLTLSNGIALTGATPAQATRLLSLVRRGTGTSP